MTDASKTLIAAALDRTGSMGAIKADAEGAFAEFLREQRESQAEVGDEVLVSLYQFDHAPPIETLETVCELCPIADVPRYEIVPRGLTPLYDAVAMTIVRVGERLAGVPEDERPGKVILVVVTDGLENRSTEYTQEHVRQLVQRQRDEWSWEFLFIGVGIDEWVGTGLGFRARDVVSVAHTGAGVAAGYATASMTTRGMRSGR